MILLIYGVKHCQRERAWRVRFRNVVNTGPLADRLMNLREKNMVEKIKRILLMFNIKNVYKIEKVYKSAWNINDTYVLKRNIMQNILLRGI